MGVPMTSVELNASDMLVNEKKFIGSIGGSCSPDRDFSKYLEWYTPAGNRVRTERGWTNILAASGTALLRKMPTATGATAAGGGGGPGRAEHRPAERARRGGQAEGKVRPAM